ncbi:MAG: citrate lyase holo-[acyl-carrier protein] synthase [Treponema sp.]|jgi:holo-ACP synthase/triphosphoribosyl-dephospho-CoA synthase|nr:citrate lyase holo-[acyl-carrier protein] synthase [Treponema sp.]
MREGDYFRGCRPVNLEELLTERDSRVQRQGELLSRYLDAKPFGESVLLSLGLNIPGEYKRFPLADRSFREEMRITRLSLEAEQIPLIHEERAERDAGYTGFMVVAGEAARLKKLAENIEDTHRLGRLFDIDVIRADGGKLSRLDRGEARPCLICGKSGFACARSKAHSREELIDAVTSIMEGFMREQLGDIVSSAALQALLGEAAVTPKPGLVDRANNGAHRDMDFFSFIDSAATLLPWFRDCALAGYLSARSGGDNPEALFRSLRQRGRTAELLMRRAAGANTHRGLLFSLGILSAAYGRLYQESEEPATIALLDFAASMTGSLGDDFSVPNPSPSHGEAIHAKNGLTGIRGEVSAGFPTVREWGLPILHRFLAEGHGMNDAGLGTLLHLIARTEDTNIVHRSDRDSLDAIRAATAAFLAGNPGMVEMKKKAAQMDRDFTARNISPGGAADLLAVSLFLHALGREGAVDADALICKRGLDRDKKL